MDDASQFMNASSLAYVEDLYLEYLRDPGAVPDTWRAQFDRMGPDGAAAAGLMGRASTGPRFLRGSLFAPSASAVAVHGGGTTDAELHQRLDRLVRNFRVRGHRVADLNPLGGDTIDVPELELGYYRITDADLGRPVLDTTFPDARTVGDVYEALRATYTRSIGAQFMHIDNLEVRRWLQARMERTRNRLDLSRATQLRILTKLSDAVIFEEFIQKKFVGAKSFSLEGSESLIPLLDLALEKAGAQGVQEVVLGMAHRGRLNVLANIMGKHPRTIFREFEDKDPEMNLGRGDVKYHLGYSSDWTTQAGHELHLSLAFNPSHLEFVNAVAMGRVRGKQDRVGDDERVRALCVLIHGDAAFIGEGIVQETLNMSELAGYRVGGTLHVIVNNQVGFTTGPAQGRSTTYASDVAKMLQSPIFHVNGEDPEAVAQVIEVAMDFRRTFQRDVVIDMYAYRRFGHNEGDEPSFTQPRMYADIRRRPNVREGYLERLLTLGGVTRDEADAIAEARREHLEAELSVARGDDFKPTYSAFEGLWKPYRGGNDADAPDVATAIARGEAERLLRALAVVPDGFEPNPKLVRFLQGARGDGVRRPVARLGGGRGARLRVARRRGRAGSAERPGQRTGHLQPSALGAARRRDRCAPPLLRRRRARRRRLRRAQQPALRERGARLRVRLLARLARWPRHLGGAVRRLRQHRAGDHRPVHRLGRGQVAAPVGPRPAAAARLRGRRPRALERAPRALPPDVRRGQPPGRGPQHARADVPPAAAPGEAPLAQAAGGHDAQEPAAPSASAQHPRRRGRGLASRA